MELLTFILLAIAGQLVYTIWKTSPFMGKTWNLSIVIRENLPSTIYALVGSVLFIVIWYHAGEEWPKVFGLEHSTLTRFTAGLTGFLFQIILKTASNFKI